MIFNFTSTKFSALLLALFLVKFFAVAPAAGFSISGIGGGLCPNGASDCPSGEGCLNTVCINCKLAAKADEYPSGCIPWTIVIACLVCGVIFSTIIAIVICWFVAACPLYKWRMGRNRQGARGYGGGGGSRAQSPRNVSKPPSKTSQNPRSKPASASASKASQKK